MAILKLNTASGGSVTLTPNDTANNYTVNLPAANSTLLTTAAIGSTVQAYDADLTAWAGKTAPTGTAVGTTDSQTLTNKTIALSNNTVSGTLAQFNTAVTDADLVSLAGSETLTNKTIALSNNTVSGTLAQFNTAVTDADLVSLAGSETLTNKTIEAGIFTNGYTEETVTANTSTAYTISLANGTVQILTLTGNCTYTFPAAAAGKSFTLVQKQDATGSRTVTWDSSVKWPASVAPTITSTASKADVFSFLSDGTYWYGRTIGQNYL